MCDFTYSHYQETLKEIKKTHRFSNFLNCSDNDIILRHDVDVSLSSALKIAKIESDLGIESTFFILFHAELYNPFSTKSSTIVKEILCLGHKLGLHYNASFIVQNGLDPSKTIAKEINILEQHYDTTINVISAHDPDVNSKSPIILPARVVNAYSDKYVVQRKYLSDSVQYWREGCFCQHYRNNKKMQILTHPVWWSDDNKSRNDIMKELVGGDLDNYKNEVKYLSEKYENYTQKMNSKIAKT